MTESGRIQCLEDKGSLWYPRDKEQPLVPKQGAGEREDSVPGGQGQPLVPKQGAGPEDKGSLWYPSRGWALGGSRDQKFFTTGPDSPPTAVFLVMWETRSVAGAEVAWRAGNCSGAGERDGSVFTARSPEAHMAQVSHSHI